MSDLLTLIREPFVVFLLILARVGALFAILPVFGSRTIPPRIRALLAVSISLLITPIHLGSYTQGQGSSIMTLGPIVATEVVLGLSLGLGVLILMSGIQLAGQTMAQMGGLALADVFDPAFDANISTFSQLMDLVTLAVFVLIGGHRMVMDALLEMFHWRPPGVGEMPSSIVEATTELLAQSFILALRAAAPGVVALLMSMVVMGLISRTMPQFNILAVGFSINSMLLLVTLTLTIGGVAWAFQEHVEPAISTVIDMVRSPAL